MNGDAFCLPKSLIVHFPMKGSLANEAQVMLEVFSGLRFIELNETLDDIWYKTGSLFDGG